MKVVVLGATGKTGSRIQNELVRRGHEVIAVARDVSKVAAGPGVNAAQSDLSDARQIASMIGDADAVVSAYAPPVDDPDQLIGTTQKILDAVKQTGTRLVVVGGAGSLEVAPGLTLLDSGHLPAEWTGIATSHSKVLGMLKASDVDWTYFSPAAFFAPGERTGKFRLGEDQLIADASGTSRISMEDYAIALVDELEKPAHRRGRFTIGY